MWGTPDWYEQAMAALSEGFCPNHHIILAPDAGGTVHIQPTGTWQPGGWCPQCRIWWHVRKNDDYPVCAIVPFRHQGTAWDREGTVII